MTLLISHIVLCLLLAAVFGFLIGWGLRSTSCQRRIAEIEAAWADRLAAGIPGSTARPG